MLLETSPDLQLPAVQLHKELLAFPFLFRYWLQRFSLIWSASYKPKKFSPKDNDYQSWSPESLQSEPLTSGCSRDPALSPPPHQGEPWALLHWAGTESEQGDCVGNQSLPAARSGFECQARSLPCVSPSKIQRNVLFTAGKTIALINCASVDVSILETSQCIPVRPSARWKCCHTQLLGANCKACETRASLLEFLLLNGHNQRTSS